MNADEPRAIRGCLYSLAGVLGLTAALLLAIVVMGTCTRAAGAEPDGLGSEESRTAEYEGQDHTAKGDGCLIFALDQECLPIQEAMQRDVVRVFQCESRWDVNAVGALGERGIAQIHPRHAEGMAREGLDYESERDRLIWARALWGWHAWAPWKWCGR